MKYVSYKDKKELAADLKLIYTAKTEEVALKNLASFKEKWNCKYPACVMSWERNWAELATFFKYPSEIRTMIYTTNAIESFNRQLRKVTKNKAIFPNDFALTKSLYLAMVDASSKWTNRLKNWDRIISQLIIYFDGIIDLY